MLADRAHGLHQFSRWVKHFVSAVICLALVLACAMWGEPVRFSATWTSLVLLILALHGFGNPSSSPAVHHFRHRNRTAFRSALRETLICCCVFVLLKTTGLLPQYGLPHFAILTSLIFPTTWFLNLHLPSAMAKILYPLFQEECAVVIGTADEIPVFQEWMAPLTQLGFDVEILTRSGELSDATTVAERLSQLVRCRPVRKTILIQTEVSERFRLFRAAVEELCDAHGLRLAILSVKDPAWHECGPVIAVSSNSILVASAEPLANPLNRAVKRASDIALSLPVVVLALPGLCVVVRIIHLLQSPGPLFYRQSRCGRNGTPFTILKFRSMHVPAENQSEVAADAHSRIFSLGRFLRASRIDEFPQFVNVLLGNMSIVGPRPHHEEDRERFSQIVRQYPLRSVIKPGITGLAQYKEFRGTVPMNCVRSRLEKDMDYIRSWSILLDVVLILKSLRVIAHAVASPFLNKRYSGTAPRHTPTPKQATTIRAHQPSSHDDRTTKDQTTEAQTTEDQANDSSVRRAA